MKQVNSKIRHDNELLTGRARLVAALSGDGFGASVLAYVSEIAIVRNFCVFYFPDLTSPKAFHSVWSGEVGDYWLRRHGALIANQPELTNPVLENVRGAPIGGITIERGRPHVEDPVRQLYDQFGILERVSLASRGDRFGYQSFFLRSKTDGWFTDEEFESLREVLPMVHEMIGLRHRIVGSDNFQFNAGPSVSGLRERRVMRFSKLSVREAEVCDRLVNGMTIVGAALDLGIAETTARTLRQRAYRKLDVHSISQLMALIVHDSWGI